MCGLVGFIDASRRHDGSASAELVGQMARMIAHRGPDGEGVFVEPECGLALGHRRLSIIDLSEAGAQPMTSADGRWVIAYNGEIYNFEEMRRSLEERYGAIHWRGHSDTEVLIETIARIGFEPALKRTNGMFAIAAWDKAERALYLARDRMGEKPLYYGWQGKAFLFASELKALVLHPDFVRRMDSTAATLLISYGYVPSPFSIWEGLSQLRPAHYVRLSAAALPGTRPEPISYWELPKPAPRGMDEEAAIEELDRLLGDAVRLRMRADVPMGAFLSGGIDSSTIVALMQKLSNVPVHSYSIGFREDAYDESRFAREVARHVGTAHTEMIVEPADALKVIERLPELYDEPFADSSQIPTYLLCRLTRQHVTVSLSGDGGDELFGGYGRYFDFERRWAERAQSMTLLRPALARLIAALPPRLLVLLHRAAPAAIRGKAYPRQIRKAAAVIGARTEHELYAAMMQLWPASLLAPPRRNGRSIFFEDCDLSAFAHPFLGMMYVDSGSYLPDDILVKVDRAAMAVSLETRVPMLDHRVVELAASLPLELKRRDGSGKWLLRRVLDRYVPRNLVERPKQGFGLPVAEWLRGPLKSWGEDLLSSADSVCGDLMDLAWLREMWREHVDEDVDHSYGLWPVLMLVAWSRAWRAL